MNTVENNVGSFYLTTKMVCCRYHEHIIITQYPVFVNISFLSGEPEKIFFVKICHVPKHLRTRISIDISSTAVYELCMA